jgi:hypothetical protein
MLAVHLDAQVEVGTDELADRPYLLDKTVDVVWALGRARQPASYARDAGLHRPVAFGEHVGLGFLDALGLTIALDAVARRAAQKVIDRNSQRLALDVPHRDIDRAKRGSEDDVATIESVPVDRLPVVRRPACVLPDKVGLELLDSGDHSGDTSLYSAFANARDTGICVHLDEDAA